MKKLEAHVEFLLDGVLWLKHRHALFQPMLEEEVQKSRGSGEKRQGFKTLFMTLFFSCALDIRNLCLDKDKRTPSITKILAIISNPMILSELRRKYSEWFQTVKYEPGTPPAIAHALETNLGHLVAQRIEKFDRKYREVCALWDELSTSHALEAFEKIRDKAAAHTEIVLKNDEYQTFNIAECNIEWGDTRTTVATVQRIAKLIGELTGNHRLDWEGLDQQFQLEAKAFWL